MLLPQGSRMGLGTQHDLDTFVDKWRAADRSGPIRLVLATGQDNEVYGSDYVPDDTPAAAHQNGVSHTKQYPFDSRFAPACL